MRESDEDLKERLDWDDKKESVTMWAVLTLVFAALAIAALVYVHSSGDTAVASNDPGPGALSIPGTPRPVPSLPQ